MRVGGQMADVVIDRGQLMHGHAPLDAPIERIGFVECKVVATMFAQQDDHAVQRIERVGFAGGFHLRHGVAVQRVAQVTDNAFGQGISIGDNIGEAGINGTARHAVSLGISGVLRQRQA